MKKLYSFLPVLALLFIVNSSAAQLASNNPYGISNLDWNLKYVNKTNILLETVDQESFLTYVAISSGGALSDVSYFKAHFAAELQAQKDELCYKVGSGEITDIVQVKSFLAGKQKENKVLFSEYKSKKAEIVAKENAKRALRTGTTPAVPFACGSPCTNPGFESGTGVWDYWSGNACSTSPDPCGLTPGFTASAHTLENISGGFDPLVGPALPLVAPGSGSQSMMIGNGPVTGGDASRASLSFTVDSNSTNFTYRYAVVLQDPGSSHSDPERPYFKVKLRDASGAVLACGDYEVLAEPPIVDFFLVPGTFDVYYRPWTTVFVPLNAYIGQCVTLEFTSSDCSLSGHYGYAYIDADCSPSTLLTSSPAVCGGASVTLTAPAGAASYQWTNISAGGTIGIVGSSTSQLCVVDTGSTYQVVMTSVTGALCTSTLTINVLESPFSFFNSFSADTVCEDYPTSFLSSSLPADSAHAWAWDFNNDGLIDSNLENPTYTFNAGGTYPVTLISTWGPCNTDTTINVSVLPGGIPVINAVPTQCFFGPNVTLVQTGATGGVWAGPGVIDSIAGTFDPSAADTTTLNMITYSTSGICAEADTIYIDVVPSGNPAWTTTSMCSNDGILNLNTLLSGTPGGTWSGPGVIAGTNFNPSGLTGTYNITYTVGASPCTLTETHPITVMGGNPSVSTVPTQCSMGSTITLFVAGASGVGTWSGPGIVNPTLGTFNPGLATIGSNQIIYTGAAPCSIADTININVVLSANPAWTTTSMCNDADTVDLTTLVTGTPGGTWSGTGVTGTNFIPTGLSGSYNVTYTVGSTPCIMTQSHLITVTPRADATITSALTLCSDDSPVNLTAVQPGGTWSGTGGTTAGGVFSPSVGPGTYTVTYTIGGACGDTDTALVNVLLGGTPSWTLQPSICQYDAPINLASLITGSTGGTFSGPGVTGNTFDPSGQSGPVNITYSVGAGICASSTTLTILVDPIDAAFSASPMSGDDPLTVDFTNGSTNWTTLVWNLANGDTTGVTNPSATYSDGTYIVTLIATNANGCMDTAYVTINVEQVSHLNMPNVFTPNGDGKNDIWHAVFDEAIVSFQASIYDRWGLKMYDWSDVHAGWNGQAKNGSPAPDGTYYYMIQAKGSDDKDHILTGYIQLLREK